MDKDVRKMIKPIADLMKLLRKFGFGFEDLNKLEISYKPIKDCERSAVPKRIK